MASFPIAQRVYPVGTTTSPSVPVGVPINSFTLDLDASLWTLPATIDIAIEASFDGGTTWRHLASITQNTPPPWARRGGSTSRLGFSVSYRVAITPTLARARAVVTGNALTLGPGTLVVN